jgi:phosphoglycolate phosphatase
VKQKKIKTIIFDFDGTIADTFPIAIAAVNSLSGIYGYKPLKNNDSLRSKTMSDIIKQDLGLSMLKLPSFGRQMRQIVKGKVGSARIFPGMKSTISRLSKDYRVIILTTNSQELVKAVLDINEINCIDEVISESSIFGKGAVISRIIRRDGLSKDQALYIGDEIRDIDACKDAGIRIISVGWGYNTPSSLKSKNPDFFVSTPSGIPSVLSTLEDTKLDEYMK